MTPTPNEESTPVLQPLLSEKWVWSMTDLLSAILFGLLFVAISYVPLAVSPIWSLATDVTQASAFPLTAGMPETQPSLLTEAVFVKVRSWGGIRALSDLCSLVLIVSCGAIFLAAKSDHQRPMLAMMSTLVFGSLVWVMASILQPAVIGVLCWSLLIWVNTWKKSTWSQPIAVAVIMMVWVNSHPSFSIGLLLLLSQLIGTVIAGINKSKQDHSYHSWWHSVILLEAGFLGFLINPDLMNRFWDGTMLSVIVQRPLILLWQPLVMSSSLGIIMGSSWLFVFGLSRISNAKFHPGFLTTWLILSVGVCVTQDLLIWYLPLTIVLIQPLLADVIPKWDSQAGSKPLKTAEELTASDFRYTWISLLIIWLAFVFSPVSRHVIGGKPRPIEQVISQSLPLGVAKHLRKSPPPGQIFHSVEWGDWLNYSMTGKHRLFVSQHSLPSTPPLVMIDYREALARGDAWETVFDRYRFSTAVLSVENQADLVKALRESENWTETFEDEQGIVFHLSSLVKKSEPTQESSDE